MGQPRAVLKAMTPEAIRALEGSENGFDAKVWRQISGMGWAGAVFPDGLPEGGSDFNDLAAHAGLEAVRLIVQRAIDANTSEADHTARAPGNESRPPGFSVDESGLWYRKDEDARPRRVCDPWRITW